MCLHFHFRVDIKKNRVKEFKYTYYKDAKLESKAGLITPYNRHDNVGKSPLKAASR